MRILPAGFGLIALTYIALYVPDYFPYMKLLMGTLVIIFAILMIFSE